MSYEAAIGQIDQILQWQEQILDPANTSQAPATGGVGLTSATAPTGAPTAGNATAFADALAQAQAGSAAQAATTAVPGAAGASGLLAGAAASPGSLGSGSQLSALLSSIEGSATTTPGLATTGLSGLPGTNYGLSGASGLSGTSGLTGTTAIAAAGVSDPRVQAMLQQANALVGKPYVWGGGHGGWGPQAGYDCSGFVSAVLHAGGYLSTPQDTTSLPSAPGIEQGPGRYVTIYDRSLPGENGHVIIDIGGQFYESGGEQGAWGGGGGVERIATPSASYLATFNTVLHPAGL